MQGESKQSKPTEPLLERVLSHPRRREILDYLTQKGGANDEELVVAFDLSAPRVRYHLSVLQSADLIAHVEDREQGTADRYIAAA
jgi:DNA-binding transcriptional ArsR family regulator